MSAPVSIKAQKEEFKNRSFPNVIVLKKCVCAHRTMSWLNEEWQQEDQLRIAGFVAEQFANRENVDIIPETNKYMKDLESKKYDIGLSYRADSVIYDCFGIAAKAALKDCSYKSLD